MNLEGSRESTSAVPMKKIHAIRKLKCHVNAIKSMGGTESYLFGSTAGDEAWVSRDFDVFIEYAPASRF